MKTKILVFLVVAFAASGMAQELPVGRDWRVWPFSRSSPWNTPIGSSAQFQVVQGWNSLDAGFNPGQWTVSVAIASASDPLVDLYINASPTLGNWGWISSGFPNCNVSPADAARLLQASSQKVVNQGNVWSTLNDKDQGNSSSYLPRDYHKAKQDFRTKFRMPPGSCASRDTDALMTFIQPDGWALETYATVTVRNGPVISGNTASYYDVKGDGTGWWNGRRASMLPALGGLIRKGEIANGVIPHALAATVSPKVLKEQAVWPAYAFDTNDHYLNCKDCLPMGSLLAIPRDVNLDSLGLSPAGLVVARAARDYGVYVVDTGGEGVTFQVEFRNPDARALQLQDAKIVERNLRRVVNNSKASPGGGGDPIAPAAPPLAR